MMIQSIVSTLDTQSNDACRDRVLGTEAHSLFMAVQGVTNMATRRQRNRVYRLLLLLRTMDNMGTPSRN